MKTIQWILFLAVVSVCLAATPVKKPVSGKKAVSQVKSAPGGKRPASKGVVSARKGKAGARPAVRAAARQAAPSSERYKEIQAALSEKGYLKSEPSGVWDADSADAMRRFQAEHNMQATGKLTAPALIGLGLGPKRDGADVPGAGASGAVRP